MFNNSSPFKYYLHHNSLPLQTWFNNINNTTHNILYNDHIDQIDQIDYIVSKQDIITHIKQYLESNNIDYNYFAESIYKNIINHYDFNNLEMYINNYLNKYYNNNQDFLVNNILDLIVINKNHPLFNKNYHLYNLLKLNGIETEMVKNFSNDIITIINEKYNSQKSQFQLEKKIITLENNITMLVNEINIINNNHHNLKKEFDVLNNNYKNLHNEFVNISSIINEINEYPELLQNNDEMNQNINFVIKDVEKLGDDVANELYKIIN
jgi:hypothetical protein